MVRPRLDIDEEQVVKLAKIGCTYREIASVVGCDPSLLSKRFSTEINKGHEELKTSVRRMQLKAALKGNVAMLIWLGKQLLDQRDKQEVAQTSISEIRITVAQAAVLRDGLQKDPEYLEYLRTRTSEGHGQPRLVGGDGQSVVGDGSSPGDDRPLPDGDGDGQGP